MLIVSSPSIKSLTLIKWRESDRVRELRLLDQICSKWHKVGILLGLGTNRLENYRDMTCDNVQRCERVFTDWINNCGHEPEYPLTWDGLTALLSDIEHETMAVRLEEVLRALRQP